MKTDHAVQIPYIEGVFRLVRSCMCLEVLAIPARLERATYCLEESGIDESPKSRDHSFRTFASVVNDLASDCRPLTSGEVRPICEVCRTNSVHFFDDVLCVGDSAAWNYSQVAPCSNRRTHSLSNPLLNQSTNFRRKTLKAAVRGSCIPGGIRCQESILKTNFS